MTDTPENALVIQYNGIINLLEPISMLYGNKLDLADCIIQVEYVKGHEPQFYRSGELRLYDEEDCSYNQHQGKYKSFLTENARALAYLETLVLKTKTLDKQYEGFEICQSQIEKNCNEFGATLTFDEEATLNKVLKMNQYIGIQPEQGIIFKTKEQRRVEVFYLTCHEDESRTTGGRGSTLLKFTPAGLEPKYALLTDLTFARDAVLKTKKNKEKDQKSGCLTPQYQQPDNFGAKPDYLNKDWLLGSANNPVFASAGIAR